MTPESVEVQVRRLALGPPVTNVRLPTADDLRAAAAGAMPEINDQKAVPAPFHPAVRVHRAYHPAGSEPGGPFL